MFENERSAELHAKAGRMSVQEKDLSANAEAFKDCMVIRPDNAQLAISVAKRIANDHKDGKLTQEQASRAMDEMLLIQGYI